MSEKPEWRLKGQLLTLTLPLSDTVSVIKAKIHEETGMPPGKQKLQWEVCVFIAVRYVKYGPHFNVILEE
jgi:splicing factor 3A subunit 1